MYYVYILQSKKKKSLFIGYTHDLKKRLEEHNNGKNISTAPRRPFTLIYCEACLSEDDAIQREKYLKATVGRRYLAKRLRNYLRTI